MRLRSRIRVRVGELLALRALSPRVAWFYWRALRTARRVGHAWAIQSATQPRELAELLRLARGRRVVVELGTGPAWTAIALGVADAARRVVTYDPVTRDHRDSYLALAGPAAARIEFVSAPGALPSAPDEPVELLFVDSSHERQATIEEVRAWQPRLGGGAVVAFHDYGHPDFPGVAQAIADLGLEGEVRGGMFVWPAP